MEKTSMTRPLRCGIGGWVFPQWRGGMFYPDGLPQREELAFASRALRCIEINGTFYRTPTATLCERWAAQTPEGFRFSMKAPRHLVQRRDLSTMAEAAQPFLLAALGLGERLGPLLWQFAPTHAADAAALSAFMGTLPTSLQGVKLQHALEVRNPAAWDATLVTAARQHNIALVIEDSDEAPLHGDLTADFVYARIKRSQARHTAGLPAHLLLQWAARARAWAAGDAVEDIPLIVPAAAPKPRDVFLLCIGADKARNPAAAMALQARCDAH